MAHKLSVKAVRCFAYLLIKVLKSLFSGIYVNEPGIQMVSVFNFCMQKSTYKSSNLLAYRNVYAIILSKESLT